MKQDGEFTPQGTLTESARVSAALHMIAAGNSAELVIAAQGFKSDEDFAQAILRALPSEKGDNLAARILDRLERELGSNHPEVLAFAEEVPSCGLYYKVPHETTASSGDATKVMDRIIQASEAKIEEQAGNVAKAAVIGVGVGPALRPDTNAAPQALAYTTPNKETGVVSRSAPAVAAVSSDKERKLSVEELDSWLGLVEMFSDAHVLLHGAAGEDAMNIHDLRGLLSRSKEALSAKLETLPCGACGAEVIDGELCADCGAYIKTQYVGEKK